MRPSKSWGGVQGKRAGRRVGAPRRAGPMVRRAGIAEVGKGLATPARSAIAEPQHQAVPVLPITNRRVRGRLPAPITNARDAMEGRRRSTCSGLLQKCSSRSEDVTPPGPCCFQETWGTALGGGGT